MANLKPYPRAIIVKDSTGTLFAAFSSSSLSHKQVEREMKRLTRKLRLG